jgi:hypothetical protein
VCFVRLIGWGWGVSELKVRLDELGLGFGKWRHLDIDNVKDVEERTYLTNVKGFKRDIYLLSISSKLLRCVRLLLKKIHTHTLQRADRPLRILLLLPVVQFREEVLEKLWVSVCNDGFPYEPHEVQLVVDVVHGQ